MELSVSEEKGLTIVKVIGRLDTVTAGDLEKRCQDLLNEGKTNLALDFSPLEYVSSAGLRSVLIVGKKSKANGGSLVLCGLSGLVEEVFSMSGFDSFFPVYADVGSLLKGDNSNA